MIKLWAISVILNRPLCYTNMDAKRRHMCVCTESISVVFMSATFLFVCFVPSLWSHPKDTLMAGPAQVTHQLYQPGLPTGNNKNGPVVGLTATMCHADSLPRANNDTDGNLLYDHPVFVMP